MTRQRNSSFKVPKMLGVSFLRNFWGQAPQSCPEQRAFHKGFGCTEEKVRPKAYVHRLKTRDGCTSRSGLQDGLILKDRQRWQRRNGLCRMCRSKCREKIELVNSACSSVLTAGCCSRRNVWDSLSHILVNCKLGAMGRLKPIQGRLYRASLSLKFLRSLAPLQLCTLPSLMHHQGSSHLQLCRSYFMNCTEYFQAEEISWSRADRLWMPWYFCLGFCHMCDISNYRCKFTAFSRGHLMHTTLWPESRSKSSSSPDFSYQMSSCV